MLGLVGFQAADVPGLFCREDLCQLQQAALELGRHLQTHDEGHNPQQFVCQVHVALQWHSQSATCRREKNTLCHSLIMAWCCSFTKKLLFKKTDNFNKLLICFPRFSAKLNIEPAFSSHEWISAVFVHVLTVSGLRLLSRSIVEKHSLTMAFLDWQNNYKKVRKHNKLAK